MNFTLVFQLTYVRKLIELPELTEESWTDHLITVLSNFLSSNQQSLLIAYIDHRSSSLQLLHSIPIHFFALDANSKLYYFIRKTPSLPQITSADEFLQRVRFGCVPGKAIRCLTSLVSALFEPLVMDNMSVQDSQWHAFAQSIVSIRVAFSDQE